MIKVSSVASTLDTLSTRDMVEALIAGERDPPGGWPTWHALIAALDWRGDALHEQPGAPRREFEHRRAFREMIKWRTGSEGRINHLIRSYGWNRTELTGIRGARTWCGHGVFAHNLVKISALAARNQRHAARPSHTPPRHRALFRSK